MDKEKRELLCELCDRDYVMWFAPNDLWNLIMRHPDGREASEKHSFVCPTCFTIRAKELGIHQVWRLTVDV